MIDRSLTSGAVEKMAPLFSFLSLVDIEMGLVNLIRNEYMNGYVFDKSFFDLSPFKILHKLYYRKESNPLYLFAKDNIPHDKLDEYYHDFMDEKYESILNYSITTEAFTFLESLDRNNDFVPYIFYYNDEEFKIIKELGLKNTKVVHIDQITGYNSESCKQVFVRYSEELEKFCTEEFGGRAFYISTAALNMNEEYNNVKDQTLLARINMIGSGLYCYDMYNISVIGGPEDD